MKRGNLVKRNIKARIQSNGLYMKPEEAQKKILENKHRIYEFCKDKTLEELQQFLKDKSIPQFPKKHTIKINNEQVEETYFVIRKLSNNDKGVIINLVEEKRHPKIKN